MIPLIITISIIAFLIVLFWLAIILLYLFVYHSPRIGQISDSNLIASKNYQRYTDKMKTLINKLMARPYEDVYISSFDKTRLHARFYERKATNKVAILCHGYRGTAYRDFCGGANEILDMGYNLLLIDERAHGLSKGHSITFGIKESKDLLCWIDYIKERLGADIDLLLVGVSMGGHTVLSVSDKVDKDVKIIADSPYSSPKAILVNSIKVAKLPVWLFYPLLNISAIIFTHKNMSKTSAYDSIRNSDNKILIIHGDRDEVVPYTDSQKLAASFPDKIQYELFPNATHGESYLEDTLRYQQIIAKFINYEEK